MSTNYYARIIPPKKKKTELTEAIKTNDFNLIERLTKEMYGRMELGYDGKIVGGEIHLGKRSGGWKFLWNPNIFVIRNGHMEGSRYIPDHNTPHYLYPLTKKGLKEFINRKDILIYDEYEELQEKEKFWEMTLEWCKDGWDSASYEEFERKQGNNYHAYPITGDLTNLLREEGYIFTSSTNSDFYSDGLRFAGFIEFS